jgi:hypothetical protein
MRFAISVSAGQDDSYRVRETHSSHTDFSHNRWVPQLSEYCTKNSLLDAHTYKHGLPREIAIPFCQTQLQAYEEVSRVAFDNSSPDARGPRVRRLLEEAHDELNTGVWLEHSLEVTVARKPSQIIL